MQLCKTSLLVKKLSTKWKGKPQTGKNVSVTDIADGRLIIFK